jgi:hypothetical protein
MSPGLIICSVCTFIDDRLYMIHAPGESGDEGRTDEQAPKRDSPSISIQATVFVQNSASHAHRTPVIETSGCNGLLYHCPFRHKTY